MNSTVTYFILIIIAIVFGFALIIYFSYNPGWLDNILNELVKPQKKDKDKLEEEKQPGRDEFGIRAIYPSVADLSQEHEQEQIWYAKWDDNNSRALGKEQKDPLDSSFLMEVQVLQK